MATLTAETQEKIRALKDHYPERRSAVMPALQYAQDELGVIEPETMNEVAELLEVPANFTAEVVSFYTMFDREKRGKYKLEVCRNLSCALKGANKVVRQLADRLGIEPGETTPDGKFSLLEVECLGACGYAPMLMVGDTYYEFLDKKKVDGIVDALAEDQTPPGGPAGQDWVR
ncbi:MAG: NAD(P)H-dependent oxidoreductase subunit E [Candidatus Eisenbacteria bacterium]|uniref:NAD(P)H-dependent oxidoreductase subunit E n=1 Tax=Eiseniibacteriota bacterium TaxID=2212470 RepID=A0A7Y2E683_UNCEI|nr:NAD(P)H-dependent oxidoreductase subunit E [Candidatus Eisenbacteria bacterium]